MNVLGLKRNSATETNLTPAVACDLCDRRTAEALSSWPTDPERAHSIMNRHKVGEKKEAVLNVLEEGRWFVRERESEEQTGGWWYTYTNEKERAMLSESYDFANFSQKISQNFCGFAEPRKSEECRWEDQQLPGTMPPSAQLGPCCAPKRMHPLARALVPPNKVRGPLMHHNQTPLPLYLPYLILKFAKVGQSIKSMNHNELHYAHC